MSRRLGGWGRIVLLPDSLIVRRDAPSPAILVLEHAQTRASESERLLV